MGAQDHTEKVLRSLHVLLSRSEPFPGGAGKVVIEKQQVLDLLAELNQCIYEIMEEYEITKRSRDKAEREFHKQGDDIVWNASRKAEDIYAASVLYTDEALNSIQEIMQNAQESVDEIYQEMEKKLKEQRTIVKNNQMELKSQLQDLVDTEKYLKLIEERNRELQREKERKSLKPKEAAPSLYADRQTEVKVNQDVLRKLGLAADEPPSEDLPEEPEEEDEEKPGSKESHKGWKGFGSRK